MFNNIKRAYIQISRLFCSLKSIIMFGRDFGSKPGSAGVASKTQTSVERRERLKKLVIQASQTSNLSQDPYFAKNHLGSYDCKLCLTVHPTEANYLAHTQGKRHQLNLTKRANKLSQTTTITNTISAASSRDTTAPEIEISKIGTPGYKVIKQYDVSCACLSLLFQIYFNDILTNIQPRYRIMSAYEQKVDRPCDSSYQYLVISGMPYNNIAFKIPSLDIDRDRSKFLTDWNNDTKVFTIQLYFKSTKSNL